MLGKTSAKGRQNGNGKQQTLKCKWQLNYNNENKNNKKEEDEQTKLQMIFICAKNCQINPMNGRAKLPVISGHAQPNRIGRAIGHWFRDTSTMLYYRYLREFCHILPLFAWSHRNNGAWLEYICIFFSFDFSLQFSLSQCLSLPPSVRLSLIPGTLFEVVRPRCLCDC